MNFTHVAETTRSTPLPSFMARTAKLYTPEATDLTGTYNPWWTAVACDRIACNDGTPLPEAFVAGYQQLFGILEELAEDADVDLEAVKVARQLLIRSMFSGAVPPRLSWHGRDAVVLFWTAGGTTSFFTITADDLSFLEEREGKITSRRDALKFDIWDRIFPISHGLH